MAREWPVVGKLKQTHVFSIIFLPMLVSIMLAVGKTCFLRHLCPLTAVSLRRGECKW